MRNLAPPPVHGLFTAKVVETTTRLCDDTMRIEEFLSLVPVLNHEEDLR